jgi:site-specific recombinase XerC
MSYPFSRRWVAKEWRLFRARNNRHAFATHQLTAGMSIQQLKDILGHRHLSTTARYLHWYPPKPLLKFDLLAEPLAETRHD